MPSDLSHVGGPNPDAADGQLALAALRRAMFDRDAAVHVDRYRLLRKIGQGAQGTVYEAEDTRLGRRLAVKILETRSEADAPEHPRLLREARAMAGVTHRHVVQVYAVGRSGGQVWIAMEFVRGTTLQQWLADRRMEDPAARAEVRRILQSAGEGLAAAHALGFVHRDFKPANVLLGESGTVKLSDFGLARPFDWLAATPLAAKNSTQRSGTHEPTEGSSEPAQDTAWAGTPRYMSPEQLRGQPAGVASDQFNFAVTTWEALFGAHPFEHDSVHSLERAIFAEAPSRPIAGRAPRALIRALYKALRPHPEDRHASLQPLLDALGPHRRSRTSIVMLVGVGACAAAASLWPASKELGPRCSQSDARAKFEATTASGKADLAAAIEQTRIPDAQEVAAHVGRELDDYAQRWARRQHEVCEAGWGTPLADQRRFDAQSACLQQALATVDALTTKLADADAALASQAVTAVRGLPDPQRCLARDTAWESPTPESRALRARLAVVQADVLGGHYRQAAAAAEQLSLEAGRESLPGVKVAALELAGESYGELSDPRRFRALTDAYYAAAETDDLDAMARVGGKLARQYAYADRIDEARSWIRHGKAALRPEMELEVRLVFEHAAGIIAFLDQDSEHGEDLLFGVLDALETLGGPHPRTSETGWLVKLWLATVYSWRGRPEDGDMLAEELREAMTRELGSGHPRLSRVATIQAAAAGERGDTNAAIGFGYEAVERAERAYGPVNPRTSASHAWLAGLLQSRGHLDEADARFRAAADASREGPSKDKARLLYSWAALRTAQGQSADALVLLRESERIGEVAFTPDSDELAALREQLAQARAAVADAR